jgi:hypothetical protein
MTAVISIKTCLIAVWKSNMMACFCASGALLISSMACVTLNDPSELARLDRESCAKQTSPLMLIPRLEPMMRIKANADAESAMSEFWDDSSKEAWMGIRSELKLGSTPMPAMTRKITISAVDVFCRVLAMLSVSRFLMSSGHDAPRPTTPTSRNQLSRPQIRPRSALCTSLLP